MTSAIIGVETTVSVSENGIFGGYDVEDIEDLRGRLKSFIQNPPLGGSDSDYIAWAKEVSGVTRAWCYATSAITGVSGLVIIGRNLYTKYKAKAA